MNSVESVEASNDDTTMISELLNSAEAMQTSAIPASNDSSIKMPLQQKCELQIIPNISEISATLYETTKKNMVVSLRENYSPVSDGFFDSTQVTDIENLNKMQIRNVHIPYILNGELYQIQTQNGENVTVKCCHCPPDRVYRGSVRSTGNFHMHIKRRHPDLLEKLHNMKITALLERRDRLMRNRKISHRNSRNRSTNFNCISDDMFSLKNEEKPELTTITPTKLESATSSSALHTHKLKIKTVFQRHQMQQREAEEMRNWNSTEYVVMPIGKLPVDEESVEPINYSLKSQNNIEMIEAFSSNYTEANQQTQQLQEKRDTEDISAQNSFESFTNLTNQPTNLSTCNSKAQKKLLCENFTNLSPSSISVSCPSVISSFSGSHQYDIPANRPFSGFSLQHHNFPPVKPENLFFGTETEAIDLTVQTDSGIYSSSEDNDSENNNGNSIINARAGSQKSNSVNVTMIDAECVNDSSNKNTKTSMWHDLLTQVESSLRDVQREMNVRNQIESNRMFLDIAKFKFLNPGFQFNW